MTKAQQRAYAIGWLRAKNPPTRDYRGLDQRRIHFDCGCSILKPTLKACAVSHRPGCRSKVCQSHQPALGTGVWL